MAPPMARHNPMCYRQAHTRPLSNAFSSEKGFIDAFQNFRRHTVASIADRQPHMRSWLEFRMRSREDRIHLDCLQTHFEHATSGAHGVFGVHAEIQEYLVYLRRCSQHHANIGLDMLPNLDRRGQRGT